MPELRPVELSQEEAARLLHVQRQTIQRRARAGELRTVKPAGPGPPAVRLSPAEDWIRIEDASALLSVSPSTIRSNIARGRLAGRREENGRWRVLLRSVLEDSRCDPAAVELFGGERVAGSQADPQPAPRRQSASLHRTVFLRLTAEEAEVLERCRDRHGTIRAAVVFGLQAIDRDDLDVDAAELRTERDLYQEQAERARAAHRGLQARTEGRVVDELYCHVCEDYVPVEECAATELEDGRLEIYHEKHGHRSGARFRSDTGLARRAPDSLDTAA